jgi:hypothetical protein
MVEHLLSKPSQCEALSSKPSAGKKKKKKRKEPHKTLVKTREDPGLVELPIHSLDEVNLLSRKR